MQTETVNTETDALLSEGQTATWLGVKTQTLRCWAARRLGPPRIKVGRTVFYRRPSVEAWMRLRERDPGAVRRAA